MSKFAVQVGILLVCVLGLFADAQSSIQGAKTLPGSPFANLFTSGIGYFSAFTPDGKYYLTGDRKTSSGSWINVWDVSTNRLVKEWKLKGESLWGGPVFSSDHSVFSIVTSEGNLTRGEVSLFDAKNWKEITTFVVLDGAGELDAHPFRSELLIAGNWDGAHRVNLTTRKIIATIPGQYKTARYSPDGQFIALGAQDLLHADNPLLGIARVIRTDSQTEVLRIKGFPKEVSVA